MIPETTFIVEQDHDTMKTLHLDEVSSGVTTAYDLTSVEEVIFVAKRTPETSDEDAMFIYSSEEDPTRVSIPSPATDGNIEVTFDRTDLPSAGVFRWRVDGVIDDRIEVLAEGPLVVKDV